MVSWVDTAGRSTRDICEDFFAAVPVLDPFTLHGFVAGVGQLLGRRIEAVAATPSVTMSCGGLVSTPAGILVWYPANTSVFYQGHVLLHEVGHLVHDHPGRPVTLSTEDEGVLRALHRLMPNLPTELIRQVLRRSSYEHAAEREAEQFATVAGPLLHRLIASARWSVRRDVDVDRLRALFAVPAPRDGYG